MNSNSEENLQKKELSPPCDLSFGNDGGQPRIVFMGTPAFASAILQKIVVAGFRVVACVTKPDQPSGRKMRLVPSPVKETAEQHSIPVLQPQRARDPSFEKELRDLSPDLVVTAAYGKILPESILSIPRHGCLNVHGSLLPRYRGAAPVQWSLLNGERETGVTLMIMDAGIDTGAVLSAAKVEIPLSMNAEGLMTLLSERGGELLVSAISPYLKGDLRPVAQTDEGATYAPSIQKEQGLIDWEAPALAVHNQIRGLYTWPGAFTFLDGTRIKIFESLLFLSAADIIREYEECFGCPEPGTILRAASGELIVSCAENTALQILSLQPQSGRRMQASECAHNFRRGMFFGREEG